MATNTTTTIASRGPQLDAEALKIVQDASTAAQKPFQAYTGQRVADLSSGETTAAGLAGGLADSTYNIPEASQMVRDYAGAPASTIDQSDLLQRTVSEYMNPYLSAALQPTIREIEESAARDAKRLGSYLTSAGAFGDARHGVAEGDLLEKKLQTIGDFTYGAHRDAYDKALDFGLNTDIFNANARETGLNRLAQGGGALAKLGEGDLNNRLKSINAMIQSGQITRQQAQDELDFLFDEFMREQDEDIKDINLRVSALGGVPAPTSTTSTTREQADNSGNIFGLIGGLINSIF